MLKIKHRSSLVAAVTRLACTPLCPLVSGLLLAACFPPTNMWPLAWIALIPFTIAVTLSDKILESILGALIGCAVFHLVALDWIRTSYGSTGISGPWASAWLITALALCPAWCFVVIVLHYLYHRCAASAAVALSIAWIVGDVSRRLIAIALTESDMPWLQLATTQIHWATVVQAADLVGVIGLSGIVAFANGSICDLLLSRRGGENARSAAWTVSIIGALLAYGAWRLPDVSARRGPTVAIMTAESLVGPLDGDPSWRGIANVLLWPEGALRDDDSSDEERVLQIERLAMKSDAIVVVGWYRKRPHSTRNSAVIANPADGATQVYDKMYLVPWVEFSPRIGRALLSPGDVVNNETFLAAGVRVAPAICYDACFCGQYRLFNSPDMIAVCSAEAADQTGAMQQQIQQIVRLRAIEFRVPIVRNVRGGHSGVIDSCGRVLVDIPDLREPTVVGPIPLDDRRSLYSVTGDWILLVPFAVLGVVQIVRARRRRARTQPDQSNN